MLVQCCMCKKVRSGQSWDWDLPDEQPLKGKISHGFCPDCLALEMAKFDKLAEEVRQAAADLNGGILP